MCAPLPDTHLVTLLAMTPGPDRLAELEARRQEALQAGTPEAVERQHQRGKLTARERLDLLLDAGSFTELNLLARAPDNGALHDGARPATDGVVTGWGRVEGRNVFVFSQDFTVFGGSLGEMFAAKVQNVMDLAARVGAPLIGLNDGAGARIQEGVVSLAGYAGIFRRNVAASGAIPQISVVLGPCAGGAVYSPAMTDYIFMVEGTSHMFITGPDVVRAVSGEDVTLEELGGATTHATRSGVATFVSPDERSCLAEVRRLLSFLPANSLVPPPRAVLSDDPARTSTELVDVVPDDGSRPYDVRTVLRAVFDDGDLLEHFDRWAPNLVCALARLDGHPVGVLANQPQVLAGVLDIDSAEKGARFVRTCDAFNIPLVTFVDVPGFRPGTDQEWGGIIRSGAKLLYAGCEATVPRVQVVVGKAYGGAWVVMGAKSTGSDLVLAWPSARLLVMSPQGVVEILHHRDLEQASDPAKRRAELVDGYAEAYANPWVAAERGYVDQVIHPADTRPVLVEALAMLRNKRAEVPERRHANVPL